MPSRRAVGNPIRFLEPETERRRPEGPTVASSRSILLFPRPVDADEGEAPAERPLEVPEIDELVSRLRWGDAAAFERLVELYWRRTLLYACHILQDEDRAADVTQEAFARLWERREEIRVSNAVGSWLLNTVRNRAVDESRRWRVRTRWMLWHGRASQGHPRTPLQDTEDAELRGAMERAIGELSPRRREAFVLFHLQDLSYREAAEIMEVRPQTVANYLHAAVADLRVALAPFLPGLRPVEPGQAGPPFEASS